MSAISKTFHYTMCTLSSKKRAINSAPAMGVESAKSSKRSGIIDIRRFSVVAWNILFKYFTLKYPLGTVLLVQ